MFHFVKRALRGPAALLMLSLATAVVPSVSNAGTGPADDRQLAVQTGWWTYTGITAAQLSAALSSNGARPTSIQVDNAAGPTFTVVMVRNDGAYKSGYWWYWGKTEAEVNSLLSTNKARPISIHPYKVGTATRYAVVMVPNSGANFKSWGWYYGTPSFIAGKLSTNKMRLIQLSPHPGSSNWYTSIMVDNTGSNNTGWWWYYRLTEAQLNQQIAQKSARPIDLSRNADGTYNAVLYPRNGVRWYWWQGESISGSLDRAGQWGSRIIDANVYFVGGQRRLVVAGVRNTNPLSEQLYGIIKPAVDSGKFGFYLKQVNGGTLASLQHRVQYEPASALKVLYHAKSIREQALGNAQDNNTIVYRYNPGDANNGGICPDNFSSTKTTNLKTADQWMMWNSDNRTTRAILEKYGRIPTSAFGTTLGMTSTQIRHNIGCPTASTYNWTTLYDLGRVYEGLETNKITSSPFWKAEFRSRMLNQSNFSGFKNAICPVVNAEAASLGKSTAVATSFCNQMTWISKGGSYQYGGSLPYRVSWGGLSLTGVPFKSSGGTIVPRFYVFGQFIDQTQMNSEAEKTAVSNAQRQLYPTAMRGIIRAALATW